MLHKIAALLVLSGLLGSVALAAELAPDEKQLTLHVNEMNCQLCAYLVNKELRNLDGVVATKANIKTQQVKVVAKKEVQEQRLIQAIDGLHYTAVVVSE
ncbi:heavy-metal-associated domain-containing protein [Testudinibacter sp. TR-2022]|uniref:heavy-metal-associated domain-containing protein n=1 Tax=Testudinibacter sp. TR-2022 TaxID=2585029 RepID=UPI00111B09D9|nr:heavy-metal-associated domain-containing protein [Testudinibacter sp. TR-2022]TNH08321.1 heavy-metal-associated domain-containing protein [Pasteurellaceae bacterium Phil11]TNH25401.1 heavy-metal-associated domain-containing protein [Testudinibacter sp. TR-2022]TNH27524.1 heavy-metal-associated domain-containing protein [Testudinibacter sp. TR-2022]